MTTVLQASPRQFVDAPSIQRLVLRALRYLRSGYAVHLRGPAGTGKTTLALHLANLLARPTIVVFGDDEVKSSDLVGTQSGYTRKKIVDNFIHSVVKVEDELQQSWVDSRLTLACKEGLTLVYDEFNRSRPEGNNVLLSVLEEKLLVLPSHRQRQEYIRVHPEFRAIFTSNPEEYCGVHSAQNALLDRMITINVPEPDVFTQTEILMRKTTISQADAATIVQLVKAFRDHTHTEKTSGLRSALMLATICCDHHICIAPEDTDFRELCQDVLLTRCSLSLDDANQILQELISQTLSSPTLNQSTLNQSTAIRQVNQGDSRLGFNSDESSSVNLSKTEDIEDLPNSDENTTLDEFSDTFSVESVSTAFINKELHGESGYKPEPSHRLPPLAKELSNPSMSNLDSSESLLLSSFLSDLNSNLEKPDDGFETNLEPVQEEKRKELEDAVKSNEPDFPEPSTAPDRRIIDYLQQTEGARLLEIEQDLELSRVELIATLKLLLREKKVIQHDRLYKLAEPSFAV